MKKIIAAAICALALTACTEREQRVGTGAGIGAATGAVIGGLATGRAGGALVGGLIGAGAGAVIADATGPRNCRYWNPNRGRYVYYRC